MKKIIMSVAAIFIFSACSKNVVHHTIEENIISSEETNKVLVLNIANDNIYLKSNIVNEFLVHNKVYDDAGGDYKFKLHANILNKNTHNKRVVKKIDGKDFPCTKAYKHLDVKVTLTDLNNITRFSKIYKREIPFEICSVAEAELLPSDTLLFFELGKTIARELVKDILPKKVRHVIKVLEEVDITLSSEDSATFTKAIKYIDVKSIGALVYSRDQLILLKNKFKNQSYVVLYDLGLAYELLGLKKLALNEYENSLSIAKQKNSSDLVLIFDAIKRVK